MPQQMALNIYRGDCYHWTFTFWTDPDATAPYDLTGATAKAEITSSAKRLSESTFGPISASNP